MHFITDVVIYDLCPVTIITLFLQVLHFLFCDFLDLVLFLHHLTVANTNVQNSVVV